MPEETKRYQKVEDVINVAELFVVVVLLSNCHQRSSLMDCMESTNETR